MAQSAQAGPIRLPLHHSHCIRAGGDPRQRADPQFAALLNRLWMGLMTADDVQLLNIRVGAMPAAVAADVVQLEHRRP